MNTVDALLRAEHRYAPGAARIPWLGLFASLCAGGFLYGAAMGSFGARPLQIVFSGLKVPILLLVSTLICLPNFFVLHCVLGLRDDFAAACRGILAAQAGVSVTLCALAPVILVHYAGSGDYELAILANGVLFLLGAIGGQLLLARHYRSLVERNPRHRIARATWMFLYTFVAIQSAWMLRPFVGAPSMETTFFRAEPWDNAYVVILKDLWQMWLSLTGARG